MKYTIEVSDKLDPVIQAAASDASQTAEEWIAARVTEIAAEAHLAPIVAAERAKEGQDIAAFSKERTRQTQEAIEAAQAEVEGLGLTKGG